MAKLRTNTFLQAKQVLPYHHTLASESMLESSWAGLADVAREHLPRYAAVKATDGVRVSEQASTVVPENMPDDLGAKLPAWATARESVRHEKPGVGFR